MKYKQVTITVNISFLLLLLIGCSFMHGGRDGGAVAFFILGYFTQFLVNLVLCIRALIIKNKPIFKLHLAVVGGSITLAFPLLVLLISATGGFC